MPRTRRGEMTAVKNILPTIFLQRYLCIAQHPTKPLLQYRDRNYNVFTLRRKNGTGVVEIYHRAPKNAGLRTREYKDLIKQAAMDFIAKDTKQLSAPLVDLEEPADRQGKLF